MKIISDLEKKIDDEFEKNPLLKLPFCHLYNLFCQICTRSFLDNRIFPYGIFTPFNFIFSRNLNFSEISTKKSLESYHEINNKDFESLITCATLNNIFPFIHSKVYNLEIINENESKIDYTNSDIEHIETKDIVLTQLSLPRVSNKSSDPEFYKSLFRRIKRNEKLKIIENKNYMTFQYNSLMISFIEEPLIPNIVYKEIGFSNSCEFIKIRNALCALSKTYTDASWFVDNYLSKERLHRTDIGEELWDGLAMACVEDIKLRNTIISICRCSYEDYEKFKEFFFISPGQNNNLDNKFMPPFWHINDKIYFMPAAVPILLSTRNLLISIQNNNEKKEKYQFDSRISVHFEPTLLIRTEEYFNNKNYIVIKNKSYNHQQGEIDLLIYCRESHSVLIIQAKATLFPENARTVRRLDSRINEGISQIKRFDKLKKVQKDAFYKSCFDNSIDYMNVKEIRAILTNSSFGSFKSWQSMDKEKIIPLNCNILRNTLSRIDSLKYFKDTVYSFIEEVIEISKPEKITKTFHLENHTIFQKHIETKDNIEFYHKGYLGG